MNKNTIQPLCNVCGEGHLSSHTIHEDVEYKGQKGKIAQYFHLCDVCGSEITDAAQVLENKREWVRFRKNIDKVPLGREIANMRKLHGLTQAVAGSLFGGGPVAFSKYEHDDFLPDEAMANLLYLAIHHPDTIYHLAARKGIPLSRQIVRHSDVVHMSIEFSEENSMFRVVNDIRNMEVPSIAKKKKSQVTLKESFNTFETSLSNGEQSWLLQ